MTDTTNNTNATENNVAEAAAVEEKEKRRCGVFPEEKRQGKVQELHTHIQQAC